MYTHGYDAVGNRTTLEFPNGVETTTAYDRLNRLVDLTTRNGVGTVLQSYALTLSPAGQRTAIDEADGTTRTYVYDTLGRMTREASSGSSRNADILSPIRRIGRTIKRCRLR